MPAIADHSDRLRAVLAAATIYAVSVFAAGFACGTARVVWLAPALGAAPAVMIELPVMLVASWRLAGWSIDRCNARMTIGARVGMGLLAFTILMLLEFALAALAFGQSPGDYADGLTTTAGRLGLAGQLAFAAMPLLHSRRA